MKLTQPQLLRVLEEHVEAMLKACSGRSMPATDFLSSYMHHYGNSLDLLQFGAKNVVQLMELIPNVVRVRPLPGW